MNLSDAAIKLKQIISKAAAVAPDANSVFQVVLAPYCSIDRFWRLLINPLSTL